MTEIASLYAKVGADTGDYHRNMRGVRDDLTSSESAMSKFGDVAKVAFQAVAVAVVAVGTAVGAMVASSVSAAADMEQGVADIGAMMALTSDETDKLKEHILDLGLDPNLKVSATEAAEAVMALGTAGLSMTQIMGGASEATVLLANATGGDFGEAANIATDVMAQFNITAAQMDKAVDQIAGTTVASKFTIDDYRLAIAQAGGVAGSVGVEFVDFNAIIAATSSSFASGSDAGTSYKTFLLRLVPTTDTAKAAMQELGLWTNESGSAFFDATGKMKGAEEVAGILDSAFGGLSDAQKISAASTIFGTDAMRTALALAEGGTPIIQKMKSEIGKVDAEELAAKRMDTLKGSWEIFTGVVDTLKIGLGDKFLPIARAVTEWVSALAQRYGPPLIEWAGKLTDKIGKMVAGFMSAKIAYENGTGALKNFLKELGFTEEVAQKLVKTYMTMRDSLDTVIAAVKAAIGPIVETIGKYVTWKDVLIGLASLMVGPLLGAFGGIIAGLASFFAPILAVIAATAALRFAWENDLGGIRTFTLATVQKISDWFFKESGIWKGTWEETFQFIAASVKEWFEDAAWTIYVTWSHIDYYFRHNADVIRGIVQVWVDNIVDKIEHWASRAQYEFAHTKDLIIQYFNEWIAPVIKKITEWVSTTTSHIGQWAKFWIDTVIKWKDDMIARFQPVLDWWADHIQPWIDSGKAVIQGFWDGIKEVWKRFTDWTATTWQAWVDRFKNFFGISSPSTLFHGFGQNLMEGLQGGIDANSARVIGAISTLNDRMVGTMKDGAYRSKAEWENAMMAIANTPFPNMTITPGVSAGQLSGSNQAAAGGVLTSIPATMTAYAAELIRFNENLARASLIGEVGLTAANTALTDLYRFAQQAGQVLNAPGGGGLSASSAAAISTLQTDTGGQRTDALLAAMQTLIAELRQKGLGSTFNLNAAPLDSTDNRVELGQLVQYLQAAYG